MSCGDAWVGSGFGCCGEGGWGGDGAAGCLGEGRHSEVDGGGLAVGELVHLGELGGGCGEADLESFDFSGPVVLLRFGDAVLQVVADAGEPGSLGWVGSQEGASDAPLTELTLPFEQVTACFQCRMASLAA